MAEALATIQGVADDNDPSRLPRGLTLLTSITSSERRLRVAAWVAVSTPLCNRKYILSMKSRPVLSLRWQVAGKHQIGGGRKRTQPPAAPVNMVLSRTGKVQMMFVWMT